MEEAARTLKRGDLGKEGTVGAESQTSRGKR